MLFNILYKNQVVQSNIKKASKGTPIIPAISLTLTKDKNIFYSTWIYVDNWTNTTNDKEILVRKNSSGDDELFSIRLDKNKNDL